jgi:GNAT superfamily N-acetyltransferase
VSVRRAAEADLPTLESLYRDFAAETPPPAYEPFDLDEELREVAEIVRGQLALVAEADGRVVGFALVTRREGSPIAVLTDLYVVPAERRRGVGAALVAAAAREVGHGGVSHLRLTVKASNRGARVVYERLRFREESLTLVAETAALAEAGGDEAASSFGSIHVQLDDEPTVERAVREFVPRLPGRSRGSIVSPPRNGWVAVYDDVCDRDPRQLRGLAQELSGRTGAVVLAIGVEDGAVVRFVLFERGSVMDEYVSVPEYHGALPSGDVVALAANPRVVARLTGADPAQVREVARQASSVDELPPPAELLVQLGRALRITGVEHGWADAPEIPGAQRVDR